MGTGSCLCYSTKLHWKSITLQSVCLASCETVPPCCPNPYDWRQMCTFTLETGMGINIHPHPRPSASQNVQVLNPPHPHPCVAIPQFIPLLLFITNLDCESSMNELVLNQLFAAIFHYNFDHMINVNGLCNSNLYILKVIQAMYKHQSTLSPLGCDCAPSNRKCMFQIRTGTGSTTAETSSRSLTYPTLNCNMGGTGPINLLRANHLGIGIHYSHESGSPIGNTRWMLLVDTLIGCCLKA